MSKNRNYWLLQLGGWGALAAAQWYAATFYLKLEPLQVAVEVVVLNGAALDLVGVAVQHVPRAPAHDADAEQADVDRLNAGFHCGAAETGGAS